MNNNPSEQQRLKTNSTLFFGELLREFLEGLGFPIVIIGLVYMFFTGRKTQ